MACSPCPSRGQIRRRPEGPQTAIHTTAVPQPIAVEVQKPTASAKPPDLGRARAAPIPSHGPIRSHPKGNQTAVNATATPQPIAVQIQKPLGATRPKDPDLGHPAAIPVAGHGQIRSQAKGSQTVICGAAVPQAVVVEVQKPPPRAGAEG